VTAKWLTAFLDTPPAVIADVDRFWLAATDTKLSTRRGANQQFATLLPADGDAFLRTQVIESNTAGIHLDLHVSSPSETASHARSLDAKVVADHGTLVVLDSPGGLPFCLVTHDGEHVRPRPVTWPGGHHSLADQVCLDIPASIFDREADFWSALTRWQRRRGGRPEFDYLARPATMPLRLLLQRVADGGPVRAHLDLACDDVPAEMERHEALGATVTRRTELWTTLRDPAQREYCITSRDPWSGTRAREQQTR